MDGEESLEDEDEESITILLGGGRGSCCVRGTSGIKTGLALLVTHSSRLRDLSKKSFESFLKFEYIWE